MQHLTIDPDLTCQGLHFHQLAESHWYPAHAAALLEILASPVPPEFVTVLGIMNEAPDFETRPHELRYLGPLYFDFDGELKDALEDAAAAVAELASLGVPPDCVRAYLTGGRGVHLEVPMGCFLDRIPEQGILFLPRVFREIAAKLHRDTLDLNVYSARRGRMWRVPNVQRPNGNYKVPVAAGDLATMTPERYAVLTATPQPFPPLAPCRLAPALATMFNKASMQVQAEKKRKPAAKTNAALRSRFHGKVPPSVEVLMQGKIQSCKGFNATSLQLAIVANAVGMTEDAFIAACAGFIRNHQGDRRYASASVRERELRKVFECAQSGYDFSVAGIRSLFPRGFRCADLAGL